MTHTAFKFKPDVPGFPATQRVVIVRDREALPNLAKQYPDAAFWAPGALEAFLDTLQDVADHAARRQSFAQANDLKSTFGPGGARFLQSESDVRRMAAESGTDPGRLLRWYHGEDDDWDRVAGRAQDAVEAAP